MSLKPLTSLALLAAFAVASSPALAAHTSSGRHHPRKIVVSDGRSAAQPGQHLKEGRPVVQHDVAPRRGERTRVAEKVAHHDRGTREGDERVDHTSLEDRAAAERVFQRASHRTTVRPPRAAPLHHQPEPSMSPDVTAVVSEPLLIKTTMAKKPTLTAKDSSDENLVAPEKSTASVAVMPDRMTSPDRAPGERTLLVNRAHSKLAGAKPACLRDVVEFSRGQEDEKFSLTTCDGGIAPFAQEHLSILVRPESAARPTQPIAAFAKAKGTELAPGVRKVDSGLIERLQAIVDHFAKPGTPAHVSVVSGYRPTSAGSYHATAQALDLSVAGVSNEALVTFCKTLPDTGCGYYPNSSFVHIDVRPTGIGHVSWIDVSGPGEQPKYVGQWPLRESVDAVGKSASQVAAEVEPNVVAKLDRELPPLPTDDHPATVDSPAASLTSPIDER